MDYSLGTSHLRRLIENIGATKILGKGVNSCWKHRRFSNIKGTCSGCLPKSTPMVLRHLSAVCRQWAGQLDDVVGGDDTIPDGDGPHVVRTGLSGISWISPTILYARDSHSDSDPVIGRSIPATSCSVVPTRPAVDHFGAMVWRIVSLKGDYRREWATVSSQWLRLLIPLHIDNITLIAVDSSGVLWAWETILVHHGHRNSVLYVLSGSPIPLHCWSWVLCYSLHADDDTPNPAFLTST